MEDFQPSNSNLGESEPHLVMFLQRWLETFGKKRGSPGKERVHVTPSRTLYTQVTVLVGSLSVRGGKGALFDCDGFG